MAVTEDYKIIIQKFIRPGKAWNGEKFKRLIGTLGIEFGRIDEMLETMEDERSISRADVMLEDFEKEYFRIPDTSGTLQERRNRILAKERAKGNAGKEFLTNIINAFGYEVLEWQTHLPSRTGRMVCGQPITTTSWTHAMRIKLNPAPQYDANYNNMLSALDEMAHANMIFIFE